MMWKHGCFWVSAGHDQSAIDPSVFGSAQYSHVENVGEGTTKRRAENTASYLV